jgi:hypothetical protein
MRDILRATFECRRRNSPVADGIRDGMSGWLQLPATSIVPHSFAAVRTKINCRG